MVDSENTYEYFAFISYKREDDRQAKWLQKKLESYSIPAAIRKRNPQLPNKIRTVFRDQSELSGGNLKEKIEKGLSSSKFLVVICSPYSSHSPWVSKEVHCFIDYGKENYIITFIIVGTPNLTVPENEYFPEGLRQLTGEKEILGIKINEMGRDAATIKVVASMFEPRFGTLWQRYKSDSFASSMGRGKDLIVDITDFFARTCGGGTNFNPFSRKNEDTPQMTPNDSSPQYLGQDKETTYSLSKTKAKPQVNDNAPKSSFGIGGVIGSVCGAVAGLFTGFAAGTDKSKAKEDVLSEIYACVYAPAEVRPHKFISYAHLDEFQVKGIAEGCRMLGKDYFFDRHSLQAGDIFKGKILKYIDRTDLFVLCWSKNAAESEWVQIEREHAIQLIHEGKSSLSIYPLCIRPEAPLPLAMSDTYNFRYTLKRK